MPKIILAAHGRITTHFHQDIGRGFLHRGIDQGHGDGTPYDLQIMAPADGVVTFAGPFGSYGNALFITHGDGCVSVLAHHARQLVTKGARVKQGQIIAVMGHTGTVFVHNHQELRDKNGNQIDPLLHLGAAVASAVTTTPLPITLKRTRKKPTMLGFAMTNHGITQWAVGVEKGVWLPVETADDANAIAAIIGSFTVISVAAWNATRAAYLGTPAA